MENSSFTLFEECHFWIEKGQKSWKSYFSKWETFAKCEENIPESELVIEFNENKPKPKTLTQKKAKQSFFQRSCRSYTLKKNQTKRKRIVKKKKSSLEAISATNSQKVVDSTSENSVEIIQNNQLEKTLKTVFSDFLKAKRNNFEVLAVLFHASFAEEKMDSSDYLFPEQSNVSPFSSPKLNLNNFSFNKLRDFPSPLPKFNYSSRTVCPSRDFYIQSLKTNVKAIDYKPAENVSCVIGNRTPQSQPRSNLTVKSCPPSIPSSSRFNEKNLKPVQLNFNQKLQTELCEKINKTCFKNMPILEMYTTQEGKGLENLCLHKRTNSVGLRMENSNFITPQRKSSEQKCFNKIVSQRRRPSKKLFFDNKEDDSESDEQTEYRAPLIRRQNKRQKVDESEAGTVDSDSDDCDTIFDRIIKA